MLPSVGNKKAFAGFIISEYFPPIFVCGKHGPDVADYQTWPRYYDSISDSNPFSESSVMDSDDDGLVTSLTSETERNSCNSKQLP